MTIKNNSLSDRLNDFKHNLIEQPDTEQIKDKVNELGNAYKSLFSSFVLFGMFILKVIVYGYSINILFNMGWNFWEISCIGLAINFLGQYIFEISRNIKRHEK